MPRFRKMPVVIDAVQWTGGNLPEVFDFVGEPATWTPGGGLMIQTLEGAHHASEGDWIIRGVHGEFYPCKPEIFGKTYEPA